MKGAKRSGMKGHKGMKPSAPPMGGGAVAGPMGASGGGKGGGTAMPLSAPKSLKGFGHPTQDLKSIATDRGSFKLKG